MDSYLHKRLYSPFFFGDHLEQEPSYNMQFDHQDSSFHSSFSHQLKSTEKINQDTFQGKTKKLKQKILYIPFDEMENKFSPKNRNFSESLMDERSHQSWDVFNKSEEFQPELSRIRNEMQDENQNQSSPRQGVLTREYNRGNPKKDDYQKNIPNHTTNKIIGLAQTRIFDKILQRICISHLISLADLKNFLKDKKNRSYGIQKLQSFFTVVNGENKAQIEAFHQFYILALRKNYLSVKLSEKSKISNLKDYISTKNKTLLWIPILYTDDETLSR